MAETSNCWNLNLTIERHHCAVKPILCECAEYEEWDRSGGRSRSGLEPREQGRNVPAMRGFLTPRDFAMIIVGVGLVALLVATLQNRIEVAELRKHLGPGKRSLAVLVAALISVFGILVHDCSTGLMMASEPQGSRC